MELIHTKAKRASHTQANKQTTEQITLSDEIVIYTQHNTQLQCDILRRGAKKIQ